MKRNPKKNLARLTAGHGLGIFILVACAIIAITFRGPNVVELLAAATSSLSADPTILYFTPYDTDLLKVGDTAKVDININAHVPINAIGLTIQYPPDDLEVVGISKEKSFLDLWTEDTTIHEDIGEVHFSGGTLRKGGLTGVGTALTLTLRAKKTGKAELSFKTTEVLAHDGTGSEVNSENRTLTYTIDSPIASTSASKIVSQNSSATPNADFNNSGGVSLFDMSILTIHLLGPYDPRYDLNGDGVLNIGDLSTFFSHIQLPK